MRSIKSRSILAHSERPHHIVSMPHDDSSSSLSQYWRVFRELKSKLALRKKLQTPNDEAE